VLRAPDHRVSPRAIPFWTVSALIGDAVLVVAALLAWLLIPGVPGWVGLLVLAAAAAAVAHVVLMPRIRFRVHRNAMGAVAGPFDAFLTHRGLKTLGVRMDRHCDNAEKLVVFLDGDSRVTEVIYPGLAEHPGHEVAARQMKRFGGMISFRVAGGLEQALAVCERAEVFTLGESLGGVESLIEHPGKMTHASVAGTDLEVPADLVRLSVGIESVDDLVADLDRSLG
jgi:cystathionine gamma-synthase